MAFPAIRQIFLTSATALVLGGCQAGQGPFAGLGKSAGADGEDTVDATVTATTSTRLVDRDVEAPEVFQIEDTALWDGRPSLGGVWVASPSATDPERVIMRNPANGKFVIGALFRRERDNPGPELQISSDAAAALGFVAGQPGKINVTALRREEEPTVPDASKPILDKAETVQTDVAMDAAAAIDRADETTADAVSPDAPAATGKRVPAMNPADLMPAAAQPEIATAPLDQPAPAATGSKRFQIGIFSVEENAQRAVDALSKVGIASSIRKEESQGKPFWSVVARGDGTTLAKIRKAGFADAYGLKG